MSTTVPRAARKENHPPPQRNEKARRSSRLAKGPGASRHLAGALHTHTDPLGSRSLRPANGAAPARGNDTAKPLSPTPAPTPAPETKAAPQPYERYLLEATLFDEVRDDPERERAFAAHRLKGKTIEQARKMCQFGMHFFLCTPQRRREVADLLKEYGVSHAPLCWPRKEIQLPCELNACPVLGKGSFNKVYALRVDGEDYAFKPYTKVADRDKKKSPISGGGETLGLKAESFHPDLRSMLAVRLADAFGLMGPAGIVDEACIAIVNGVPGLLTRRIHGRVTAHGNLWDQAFEKDSLEGKLAKWALKQDKKAGAPTGDPAEHVHALGLVQAVRGKDHFYLTGAHGKRSDKAAQRFESASFNQDMSLSQFFIWLAMLGDHHVGNILNEKGRIKLIDLEEAFCPIHPDEVKFEDAEDAWIMADLPLPLTSIPRGLQRTLKSERCPRLLSRLLREASGFLPEADLTSLARRIKWLLNANLPEFGENEHWKVGQNLQPHIHLRDRVIGFSTHDFGESEDSISEAESITPPVGVNKG